MHDERSESSGKTKHDSRMIRTVSGEMGMSVVCNFAQCAMNSVVVRYLAAGFVELLAHLCEQVRPSMKTNWADSDTKSSGNARVQSRIPNQVRPGDRNHPQGYPNGFCSTCTHSLGPVVFCWFSSGNMWQSTTLGRENYSTSQYWRHHRHNLFAYR